MTREFQFYIVPTPIGNIDDITYRAVQILKNVDLIACEDTRVTQKLLNHYDIKTRCISYHKYNEKERVNFLISELEKGNRIALVSDAGTPMICDPGNVIVQELLARGLTFTSLAGACAITTFLSEIPRNGEEFTFIGFISRAEKQIKEVALNYINSNFVFYDSPERILKTLEIIKSYRGDITIALGRELTKLFEEIKYGKISEILEYFKDGIKGEIVCMIYAENNFEEKGVESKINMLKENGFKDKEIATILATLFGYNKNKIYKQSMASSNK